MQRTADAVSRHRHLISDLVRAWGTDVQLRTLPLTTADAQRVRRVLQQFARAAAEPFRGSARIGLGLVQSFERRPVAVTFRRLSVTAPDGSTAVPIAPSFLGRLDTACRVDGRAPVSGPTADLSDLEDEPVWAAGVGYCRQVPGVPVITSVLALGHSAPLAAARGMALAVAMDVLVPDVLRLKVVPVRRIDARVLRQNIEAHLAKAQREGDDDHLRHSRIALGELDASIDTSLSSRPGPISFRPTTRSVAPCSRRVPVMRLSCGKLALS